MLLCLLGQTAESRPSTLFFASGPVGRKDGYVYVAETMSSLSATNAKETPHRDSPLHLRQVRLEGLAFRDVFRHFVQQFAHHTNCGERRIPVLSWLSWLSWLSGCFPVLLRCGRWPVLRNRNALLSVRNGIQNIWLQVLGRFFHQHGSDRRRRCSVIGVMPR